MSHSIFLPAIQRISQQLSLTSFTASLSLTKGNPGLVLTYGYLYHCFEEAHTGETFVTLLDDCFAQLETTPIGNTLADGMAGLMWTIRHLMHLGLIDEENEELITPLETRLIRSFEEDTHTKDYDLLHGLIGKSMYFLESPQAASSRQVLMQMVTYLKQWAISTPQGYTWDNIRFQDATAQHTYNIGMAHGTPAIIWFLARVYTEGIEPSLIEPLLDKSVSWLLAQQKQTGCSCFPSFAGSTQDSRLAWCYGDLGPALALLAAGKALKRTAWIQKSIDIAIRAATRTLSNAQVYTDAATGYIDGGFCHGLSGLSHIFFRLYQHTGRTEFVQASHYWSGLLLSNPAFEENGYVFPRHQNGQTHWQSDASLLNGSAGIILTLLSQLKPRYTAWDRIFMTT